jgi:hypothetical protein
VSAAGGHASSDGTVTWVRRHLDLLRIGGAVIAAPAVLIFRVNWVTLLIIAVLLALYQFGLHRLRQTEPAHSLAPPPAPGRNRRHRYAEEDTAF